MPKLRMLAGWLLSATLFCAIVVVYGFGSHAQARLPSLESIAGLVAAKQWQAAAPQIAQYRAQHPGSISAAILQSEILIHLGLLADANAVIQRVLTIHPRSIEALTAYADLTEGLHETTATEQLLLRCTRYAPQDPAVWLRLGDFYLANGRREALTSFQKALRLAPHRASAISGIAAFHHQQSDNAAALREFEQADVWNRNSKSPAPIVDLRFADFLSDTADYSASLSHYQRALEADSSLAEARLGRAKDEIHLRQWQAAEDDLKLTAATDEWRIESLNLLIKVYEAEGKTRQAEDAAGEAAHLSAQRNTEKAARNQIATGLQNARALQDQQHFAEAAKAYEELLQAQPDAQAAWMDLGECYAALGRIADGEAAFRRSIHLQAESLEAHVQLGKLLLREQHANDARDEFIQAMRIDPLYIDARLGIAASFMVENQFKDAIGVLRTAKSLPGSGIAPRLMLTEALFKSGRKELALKEVGEALAKYPGDKQALAMRESLRNAQR